MFIQKLRLQNYRCFLNKTISFEKPFVLIEGDNGSGKTTILEALHYGCFLKSFRTNRTTDLIAFDKEHFFLQIYFEEKNNNDQNYVQIGVGTENNQQKKLIQLNKKVIKSYRELINYYRIVSLTEDDLQLVQGAPEVRRFFLNQLIVLFKPDFIANLRKYRHILEHRNNLLIRLCKNDELQIWTEQLWEQTKKLQKERIYYLQELEEGINDLLTEYFPSEGFTISLKYFTKNNSDQKHFDSFWSMYKEKKLPDEYRMTRSLFGAHLDDFAIIFQGKKARYFASRGQQKLVLFLIKIALAQKLEQYQMPVVLILDDFLTDFDHQRISACLLLLSKLSCQKFISCPLKSLIIEHYKGDTDQIQVISL